MTDENRARPGGVIAVGIISIIFGVLGLLMAALMVLTFITTAREQALPRLTMLYSTIPYWAAGIAWIVAGIGLLCIRNWARVMTIVLSFLTAGLSILIFIGVAIAFIFIGITRGSPGPLEMVAVGAIGIILPVIFAGIPIWFIVYLCRGKTKQHFRIRPDAIRRPLGVNILVVLYFLGTLGIISTFAVEGIPVCGIIVRGPWFLLFQILFAGISLYLAIGFRKLKRAAWITAIYYNVFLIINSLLTFFLVTPEEMLQLSGTEAPTTGYYPVMFTISLGVGIVVGGMIIVYLYKKRHIFIN